MAHGSTTYLVRSPADLGRALAELRRARGLSQADLAERLGLDRSYVTKVERGHSSPLLVLVFDVLAELEATVTIGERGERVRG
jgi:HTH-type transcriptional regulator / antitoxin HipB